jgi:nucleotide-binding universal stress UspA family protein
MFDPKQILHPTDFSPSARAALQHAIALAREHGATLHLLHADPALTDDPIRGAFSVSLSEEEAYAEVEAQARKQLDALCAEAGLDEAGEVDVVTAVKRGLAPGPVIVDYARHHDIDLIAMGTHGRRGVRRFVLGSVAEEVTRHAEADVLTVRAADEAEVEALTPEAVERVLVPIDFSAYSRPLAEAAVTVARDYTAALDLLHVVEPLPFPVPLMGAVTLYDLVSNPKEEATKLLDRLADEVRVEGGPAIATHVEDGHAALTITEVAEARHSDLIVIASHGLTGLERVLLGSVTARVTRRAPCPVLVLRVPPSDEDNVE